ncbi:ABC transporter permease [Chengkuizengella axinellae]|uniref:ABC transporter permease n=1 Tax=Chengkuizengella axinellae TaxID=3064388 RepID=A0ABT9IVE9_9BACL|nr:ABC transporter permease [Chengkuizengella sp. 2205SS18-9]MDP5273297.1 ABC transporter permease [Chengkuizengella sp. 2205SS18-9]
MKMKALVIRIIKQFINDKRTLAMILVAPMFILWLMSQVFHSDQYEPTIALVDIPEQVSSLLENQDAQFMDYTTQTADAMLTEGSIDAILTWTSTGPELILEGSDPSVNKSMLILFQNIASELSPASNSLQASITYLHGSEDMTAFDSFGPVLIGVFAFFFVFLTSGISFLRERTTGTLERLMATPVKRWELVIGYVIGFGIFSIIQAALIAWFSIQVLDMLMMGSIWLVLLVTLLLAMTALTLGTLLSAFANNEFQMVQFIPLVIVPQVFLSGLFNIESMSEWLQWLSILMPLSYGADALREIMVRGSGWNEIAVDVYVLSGFSVTIIIANIFTLKKYRKL